MAIERARVRAVQKPWVETIVLEHASPRHRFHRRAWPRARSGPCEKSITLVQNSGNNRATVDFRSIPETHSRGRSDCQAEKTEAWCIFFLPNPTAKSPLD